MLQDSEKFEQYAKMALDGEQQYKTLEEQASKELAATEFCHVSAPDFEEFEEVMCAQNQAPLDMLAELKAINQRLDLAEEGSRKQAAENRIWQAVSITIGLLTLGATILFGILALLR